MRNRTNPILFTLVLLLALAEIPSRASEFLLAETGARAVGSSGAYAAAEGRLDCLNYNPAGLASLPRLCGVFSHNQSFEDVSHDWAALGLPLGFGVAAVEYLSWQVQPFSHYDAVGNDVGQVRVESKAAGLGAATSFLNSSLDLGVRGRLFYDDLAGYTNNGFALDLGCVMNLPGLPLSLAFCAQNLGWQTAYIQESDPLPLRARLGASFHPQFTEMFGMDLRADWVKYARPDGYQEIRLGAEVNLMKRLSLEAGAQVDQNRSRLSMGAVFDTGMFELAYAYVPDDLLGPTQEITLAIFDLPVLGN